MTKFKLLYYHKGLNKIHQIYQLESKVIIQYAKNSEIQYIQVKKSQ